MRSLTMVFVTLLWFSGTALATTAEQDSPAAEAAWREALAERDPIRRRQADFKAARVGSLPAMERLLFTARFDEVAMIDLLRQPFTTWPERASGGVYLTPIQIHGMALANWTMRHPLMPPERWSALMETARKEMETGPISHSLLAMEIAWHRHSFPPHDPMIARQRFDEAIKLHETEGGQDGWIHFCVLIDLATVAVNNGYGDVASALVDRAEREAMKQGDPYAIGLACDPRAYLQTSDWTGQADPHAAIATCVRGAGMFSRAEAPIMRAQLLMRQAAASKSMERTDEVLLLYGQCAAIYGDAGAPYQQALTLMMRSQTERTAADAAADFRAAAGRFAAAGEIYGQATATIALLQTLLDSGEKEDREEMIRVADGILPLLQEPAFATMARMVQSLRRVAGK